MYYENLWGKNFATFLVLFCLMVSPVAEAKTLTLGEKTAILQEIQKLTAQVIALQAQLRSGNYAAASISSRIYESRFYKGAYETVYKISNNELKPYANSGWRAGDQAVFDTYLELIGEEFVSTHVDEFRIFNDQENLMSGFIEQKDDASWLLAINRFNNDLIIEHEKPFMIELLLHESAHIVFFLDDTYKRSFERKFWQSSSMQLLNDRLERRDNLERKADIATDFYESHPDWFVSDYAPSSPDEDLVETFVTFIISEKPTGDTVAEQKIQFFYDYPEMVQWRNELRNKNLLKTLIN